MIEIKPGTKFGRLEIIKENPPIYCKLGKMIRIFCCKCECGIITNVRLGNLRNSSIKSCGCLQKEIVSKTASKHGQSWLENRSPEYECWMNMKQRCTNPKSISWKYYGERGIKMCDRWLNSFQNFFVDMGKRPSNKHSIERINNDGNYELSNCKWATKSEQMKNQRRRKKYEK